MFTMDRQGIVTHINQQAKERFGLFNHSLYSHPAGRLEPGDIVILATSAMGADDGGLTAADLSVLDIHDARLRPNDILAAVGVYKGPGVKPVYKYLRGGEAAGLHLDVTFQGVPISVHIGDKEIVVEVREKAYSINYFVCIGQMVVLDHRTKQVKFWEEKGYSARKEGIGSLLRGGSFIAKSPEQEICVVGYHFRDFFEGELFEEHLRQVLDGRASGFSDVAYEINGFALLASILPIRDGAQVTGIIVKFRNIEDIRTTIMERNTAIAAAERKYRESSERAFPGESNALLGYGSSAALRSARRRAYKLSQMDCNIFITGEAGTGRTRMAQSIQQAQQRGGPFIRADCSAVDPALLEVTLFGSQDGTPGLFREADGGRGGRPAPERAGEAALRHPARRDTARRLHPPGACGRAIADHRRLRAVGRGGERTLPEGSLLPPLRLLRGDAAPAGLPGGHLPAGKPADGGYMPAVPHPGKIPLRRGIQQAHQLRLAGQPPRAGKRAGGRGGHVGLRHHLPGAHSPCLGACPADAAAASAAGGATLHPAGAGTVRRRPPACHAAAGRLPLCILRTSEGIRSPLTALSPANERRK